MHVIRATNVNDAYRKGMALILAEGDRSESRNGPVLRIAEPVSTVYDIPHERVLFDRKRHANPFFHLFEALWMLNGGNDVETMDGFLKSFKQFSDDGTTFHGAYGHRWRHWPVHTTSYVREIDQINLAIRMLKANPANRRIVIAMWDPVRDLAAPSNDIPCNDMIKLSVNDGRLDMIIFNRSNDVVWGCYGANAVHMSVLQEYIATMANLGIGRMTQISCDFHAYLETPYNVETFVPDLKDDWWYNPYDREEIKSERLVTDIASFDAELRDFMTCVRRERSVRMLDPRRFRNSFFRTIAFPMHNAWEYIRDKRYEDARMIFSAAQRMTPGFAHDWILAGDRWLDETLQRKERNEVTT